MKALQLFALAAAMITASFTAHADNPCQHEPTCKPPKRIKHVPAKITKSGKYCVDCDLYYEGSNAAIEICADNVSINFNNHSLTLENPAATGILAKDVQELTLMNDKISFEAPFETVSGYLITLEGVNKATIDNVFLFNAQRAISLFLCSDIRLINSQIRECNASHIDARYTNEIVIDNCNFYNSRNSDLALSGMFFFGTNNIRIANTQLYNSNIWAHVISGLITDNVTSIIDDPENRYAVVELGSSDRADLIATDCKLRNSQFTKVHSTSDSPAIFIVQGSDIVIENCTVASDSAEDICLQIGSIASVIDTKNILVRNSLFRGPTECSIAVVGGSEATTTGVEIKGCVMQGAQVANLIFAAAEDQLNKIVGCSVKNNTLQNGLGDGILATPNSITGCSFLNNLIANNCGRAMYIAEGCTDNIAAHNKALRNGNDLIDDGTNNLFDDNTEFNNTLICNGEDRVERRAQVQINLDKAMRTMENYPDIQ